MDLTRRAIRELTRPIPDGALSEIRKSVLWGTRALSLAGAVFSFVSGVVDWTRSAGEIYDRYRAFVGWPGTVATLRGAPIKITACRPATAAREAHGRPGEIAEVAEQGLVVYCGRGTRLSIQRVQRPGKRAAKLRKQCG